MSNLSSRMGWNHRRHRSIHALRDPLRQAILAAQGEQPLLVPALGGSLPDYVFTKILGVPAFTIPYANADESNHAPNENIEVERFIKGIKTGAAMVTFLVGGNLWLARV